MHRYVLLAACCAKPIVFALAGVAETTGAQRRDRWPLDALAVDIKGLIAYVAFTMPLGPLIPPVVGFGRWDCRGRLADGAS